MIKGVVKDLNQTLIFCESKMYPLDGVLSKVMHIITDVFWGLKFGRWKQWKFSPLVVPLA